MYRTIPKIFIFVFLFGCKKNETIQRKYFIDNTNFSFAKMSAQNVKNIESQKNGIQMRKPYKIELSESYFPEIKKYEFEQPLIYWRDSANIKNTISYFFTKKDSLVRVIEYSWSKPKDNDSIIAKIYKNNIKIISEKLKQKGKIVNETKDSWKQQIISWENDSIYVWSFIFSQNLPERTRVIIRQKN